MKKIEKGDTVIFKVTVQSVTTDGTEFAFDRTGTGVLALMRTDCPMIVDVIAAPPPEPKVGDSVIVNARKNSYGDITTPHTLVAIHQEPGDPRKWGIIAFKGDIPKSVWFEDLRVAP